MEGLIRIERRKSPSFVNLQTNDDKISIPSTSHKFSENIELHERLYKEHSLKDLKSCMNQPKNQGNKARNNWNHQSIHLYVDNDSKSLKHSE